MDGTNSGSRKIIESLLRVDLTILDELGFAPLDDTGTQLLFRLVAGAYERRSLAIGSHWPFEHWGRFLPEQTTAVSILDCLLHHATVVITDGPLLPHEGRPTPKGRALTKPGTTPQGGDFRLATSGDNNLAIDRHLPRSTPYTTRDPSALPHRPPPQAPATSRSTDEAR